MRAVAMVLLTVIMLCSCTDISGRTLPSTATSATPEKINGEDYKTYTFSQGDEAFIANAYFVGDKLALGLYELGISENVVADAGLTPSKISGFTLSNGLDVKTSLINSDAAVIVFFMESDGSDADGFTDYIKEIRAFLPESTVYAMSSPPINDYADAYNDALKKAVADMNDDRVIYVDTDTELANDSGKLKSLYADEYGDLTQKAYYAALWKLVNANPP